MVAASVAPSLPVDSPRSTRVTVQSIQGRHASRPHAPTSHFPSTRTRWNRCAGVAEGSVRISTAPSPGTERSGFRSGSARKSLYSSTQVRPRFEVRPRSHFRKQLIHEGAPSNTKKRPLVKTKIALAAREHRTAKLPPIQRSRDRREKAQRAQKTDQVIRFHFQVELNGPSPVLRTPSPIRWERDGVRELLVSS